MMTNMAFHNILLMEQIATKERVAINGVMMKQLFYDLVNPLHGNSCLNSTREANCYDAINPFLQSLCASHRRIHASCSNLPTLYPTHDLLPTGYGFGMASTSYTVGLNFIYTYA